MSRGFQASPEPWETRGLADCIRRKSEPVASSSIVDVGERRAPPPLRPPLAQQALPQSSPRPGARGSRPRQPNRRSGCTAGAVLDSSGCGLKSEASSSVGASLLNDPLAFGLPPLRELVPWSFLSSTLLPPRLPLFPLRPFLPAPDGPLWFIQLDTCEAAALQETSFAVAGLPPPRSHQAPQELSAV